MATIVRQRRDTAANWTTNNPIVPNGQLCFDTTNNTLKIGDGVTNYNNLPSSTGGTGPAGPMGATGATGPAGADGSSGSGSGDLVSTMNLSDLANVTTARSNLGLVIGTNVQAFDSTIVVDADIGTTVQAYDSTIVVDADIGTTVQAYDADLATLATNGIGTSANQLIKLDSMGRLPAVSGFNLTNIPPAGGSTYFTDITSYFTTI
jgi:hypothetical protein